MATQRMIARERACLKLSARARQARTELKNIISNVTTDFDEKMLAVTKLNKRRRDESPIRVRRRCRFCGRAHAVYRKFGLCRLCLRKAFMFGLIPGVRKASW